MSTPKKRGRPSTHRLSESYEYYLWIKIKRIAKCKSMALERSWIKSAVCFINDTGKRPSKKHFLIMINPKNGYVKSNMVWKYLKTSKRIEYYDFHVKVAYQGKRITICDLADKIGISQKLLLTRLRQGMDLERAVTLINYKTGKPLPKKPTY